MGCKVVLGDICSFSRGASIPRARMHDTGDYLYIHYGDLYKGFDLRIDVESPSKPIPFILRGEKVKESQCLKDQDIVYVLTSETVDDLGHAYLFNNPQNKLAVSGTETTIVRVKRRDLVIPAYLNYLMSSPCFIGELRRYVRGMKVFRVHPADVSRIEIELPHIETQRKVVSILDSIYTKQRINTQLNGYLEKLVSLEFSRRFKASTPTIELGKVLSISTESIKPQEHAGEIWEHYSIPAYDENRQPLFELSDGIKSNKYAIDANCILISKLNPATKRIWMPSCTSEHSVCSTEFIVYKPKNPRYKSFYYAAIDSQAFTDFLIAHVTGSTGSRQRTQPKATLTYPMPNPGHDAIEGFCAFANPIYKQIQSNKLESKWLVSLRDALLPKLMSGEIDVSKIDLTQLNSHLA
ncbi:restriction endonuclease subunit S [Bifidobacterium adolescentis]|uniref:restriction endonuclease subunit S n=1 Tax=Bifidobacterium adolescentis TaxID=1680 RepID=UPI0034A4B7F6